MASSTTFENTAGGSTKLLYNDTSVNDYVVELPKKNAVLASTDEANFSYKPTPVSITSWGYVTTTITLNVASHTFIAGDYIEVGGLTATTNIPNGVHLVTSVTATTIVFTYALTPTGTAGVSSATVKGYMTTNGRPEGVGIGQTQQDLTGSRALGVTYTNSTNNPIWVKVTVTGGATTTRVGISFTNDGITFNESATNGTALGSYFAASHIILAGKTYSAVNIDVGTLLKWVEVR